jgi:hypothetical protein
MTIKTAVIQTFITFSDLPYVPLSDGLRLQVLPDISFLSRCQKHHFAAFIQNPGMLVVWDDDPEHIIARAEQIENRLVGMIWRNGGMKDQNTDYKTAVSRSAMVSRTPSIDNDTFGEDATAEVDQTFLNAPRRTLLFQPMLTMLTGILVILAIGVGWRNIAIELKVDKNFLRCILAVVVPLQIWMGWVRELQKLLSFFR